MSNPYFHILIIARADHRIISADYGATDFLGHDRFSTLDEHLAPEDRTKLEERIDRGDTTWFYVELQQEGNRRMFGMRLMDLSDPDYVRLQAVALTALIQGCGEDARRLESYEVIFSLFDDIYYDYNPENDRITLFHAEKSAYGTGVWQLDDFAEQLRSRTPENQKIRIHEFVSDLRSGTGYFRIEVDTDLTGQPAKGAGTLLTGRRVPHYDGMNSVAGTIHQIKVRKDNAQVYSEVQLDSLTGLIGRKDIIRLAKERISSRADEKMALAITDIDFFKNVNDTFGHKKGDEVIRNVAGIINSVIGSSGVVGRYGGDEFLLVLYRDVDEESLRNYFRTIREEIHNAYPDLWGNAPLSLSVGCAVYPTDAQSYEDLFLLADYCLYRAKYKGRNRYIIYTPAKHGTLEAIRARSMESGGFRDERNTSMSDMLINMACQLHYGEKPRLQELMHDFTTMFDLDNLELFGGDPLHMFLTAGKRTPASAEVRAGLEDAGKVILKRLMKESDFLVINRLESIPPGMSETVSFLEGHGIYSILGIRFHDANGTESILFMTSVGRNLQWNETYFKYYRLFADILSHYDLTDAALHSADA